MKSSGSQPMLKRAALARQQLTPESAARIRGFIDNQHSANGGFLGRAGYSDLYYTVFGLSALLALRSPLATDRLHTFLDTFGDGDDLDFVHLNCLLRCRRILPFLRAPRLAERLAAPAILPLRRIFGHRAHPLSAQEWALLRRIEAYRAADGGYHQGEIGAPRGSVYASFLALQTYEDCGQSLPNPEAMIQAVLKLRTPDGGYANEPGLDAGTTTATAAASLLLADLRPPVDNSTADWLLARATAQGGFLATPGAPVPDLLSTATALHALRTLGVPLGSLRDACLGFVESLWTVSGGFSGNILDPTPDCEYSFYGLLALGCLAQDS